MTKEQVQLSCVLPVCGVTPGPAMIDTQQHPPTGSTMKWKAQKNSARAVPFQGEQPLLRPQSEES